MTQLPMFVDARTDLAEWARRAKERIDGRLVVVSISGGKDSTATALLLKEAGIPFRAVHMDTGWEHELTEKYVRETLPKVLGVEIEVLQSHRGGLADLAKQRGMFPSRMRRYCTQELKVRVILRFIRALQAEGEDPINVVGIRREESLARSELPEWEEQNDFDCEVWRPIVRWTLGDVVRLHQRHGVEPNPLYLLGAERVGCWPCIYARKAEIRLVAELTPERIDEIEQLEREVAEAAAARYAERGETFESRGYVRPTFFMANKKNPETGSYCTPIREAVAWSKTKYGGKVVDDEPFLAPLREQGCMRWGLCDTTGVVASE